MCDNMDLIRYRVIGGPPTVYYIPNFISPNEEEHILKHVYGVPKPKWTCLSNRKLQDYGGIPHKNGMILEKIPDWLQTYTDKVSMLNVFGVHTKPNQVLINEYLPGQGIMPHLDGPLFHPTITTISCGSHTVLEFLENSISREKVCDLLLERFSLVVLQDDMYTQYLHSIGEKKTDVINDNCINLSECSNRYSLGDVLERNTRISLTIRNVPKVLKLKLF